MPWFCCRKYSSVDERAYIDPAKFNDQILLPTDSADRDNDADMQAVRWIRSVSSKGANERQFEDSCDEEEDLLIFNHDNSFDQGEVQSQGTLDYTSNHDTFNHEHIRSERIIPNPLINIIPMLSEEPIPDTIEERKENSGDSEQSEGYYDDSISEEPFEANFESQESIDVPQSTVNAAVTIEERTPLKIHLKKNNSLDVISDGGGILVGGEMDSNIRGGSVISSKSSSTDRSTNDVSRKREAIHSVSESMNVISPTSASSIMERDRHANEIIRYDGWQGYQEDYSDTSWSILGTSLNDETSKPHVLSPPLLEALQGFLPVSLSTDNFWMKYSLVRDGASLRTLLTKSQSPILIIAIETLNGEVFGSFTTSVWKESNSYFGQKNGTNDAFLWRLKNGRMMPRKLISSGNDSNLEVFPYARTDDLIQFCNHENLIVGGGEWKGNESPFPYERSGPGLILDADLCQGESFSCSTFSNSALCRNGSFKISNVETWTITPCATLEGAIMHEKTSIDYGNAMK